MRTSLITLTILASLTSGTVLARVGVYEVPQKFLDAEMTRPSFSTNRFRGLDLSEKGFVERKLEERRACRQSGNTGLQPLWDNGSDMVAGFIGAPIYVANLKEMEAKSLLKGKVDRQPWSGDYWAISKGILGARNFDVGFNELFEWLERYNFIQANPAKALLEKDGQAAVGRLSPSEKYELIIGDKDFNFTKNNWDQGKQYHDAYGNVEGWMGICHGWAPAAMVEPRPAQAVEVKSADQAYTVKLNPSEVKGLVSYNWANNRYDAVTLGSRCNEKDPEFDETDRAKKPECNDMNPATWHIVVANLVGAKKQSFVLDATFDYEVWNQPVLAYEYTYYNPKTGEPSDNLEGAQVALSDYPDDGRKKFRSPRAVSVVGINMKLAYVLESSAEETDTDNSENDIIRWVRYKYDLELDSRGRIVGGEWQTQAHPDFIWKNRTGARPQSPMDAYLGGTKWDLEGTIPSVWATMGQKGAEYGIILDALTRAILEKASGETPRQ